MSSFGKLYAYKGNPRTTSLLAVAKANNLNIDLVNTQPGADVSTDYLKLNKLGKIPTFEGSDGYVLTEAIAIAVYLTSQNEKTTLLGKTKQDYASILRWMSYANSEVLPSLAGWFRPLIGKDPYNKKSVEDSKAAAEKKVKVLEDHLLVNTYLVGERLTLADLFGVSIISRGFEYFYDKEWRAANPNVTRWFETVSNQSIYTDVADKYNLIDKAIANVAPKQTEKPKAEKPAAAPKAAAAATATGNDEDEEEAKPAPKPKHPLEALGRPTFVLDDWKRKYSNEDTREVALPWFWENCNFEEYSLWKVDYKYNDELTHTFMSSNLVSGFFTRLEASRKYLFGEINVFGTTNDSILQGVFLVRGQEIIPAVDVGPDYDSYSFEKLDAKDPKAQQFVNDQWASDKEIEVNGKTYPVAEYVTFK